MYRLLLLVVFDLFHNVRTGDSVLEKDKNSLFNKLRDRFLLEDPRIEAVLRKYCRSNFLPFERTDAIYKDKYIYLGCGAEFSSPFVQAEALHLLRNHLKPGSSVLELGSGTGYVTTCMADLVQPNGSVIGLDLVSPLVDFSIRATMKHARHLVEKNIMKFFVSDGRYGYSQYAPFDAIYTDLSHRAIPSVLLSQLKPGGRLVMTLGRTELPQYIIVLDKDMLGRTSFSRVRLRNKVPRLCSNIKEQDLYYQRMYPLKHGDFVPTLANGQYYNDRDKRYKKNRFAHMERRFDSEELERFAAAERRYQDKVEQLDMHYGEDDNLMEMNRPTTTRFGDPTQPPELTTTPLMEYEIWSAVKD